MFGGTWPDLWARTWGARGLPYVWVEEAVAAITAGLADEEWRPAEMCLKVAALREVGTAGDGAVRLLTHELPRVRANAIRTLGLVGDTEHVGAVEPMVDDPDEGVRRQAHRALERLRERLDLFEEPGGAGPGVRARTDQAQVCEAVGWGSPRRSGNAGRVGRVVRCSNGRCAGFMT